MNHTRQKFCTARAVDAQWTQGLRKFFEYRDLGIGEATGGHYNAHVIRVKNRCRNFLTPDHTCTTFSSR